MALSVDGIALRGVGFAYAPERPVLDGLDLALSADERVALLGPNGSGKTTLLHVMVGLLRPHAGHVEAFGRVRRTEDDFREVRRRAGLLFQDPEDQLFCPTVLEDVAFGPINLGLARAEALDVAGETLAALGLGGYEQRITYKLSGGEKRLVSLAAVLAMKPDVLLLDEPTGDLDGRSRHRLLEMLSERTEGLLLVTHDLEAARELSRRAVLLADGRIAADRPAPDLLADGELLARQGLR
jgi:cobalt/nickel transport system ATP-binding protein